MTGIQSASAQPYAQGDTPGDARLIPWPEARRHLETAQWAWLATTHPDGGPHAVPVLTVWMDGMPHFATGRTTRKARNLALEPRCALNAAVDPFHLVIAGEAAVVRDEARLRRVAEGYIRKYGWRTTVRDGAFHDVQGAPSAGPPPYDVYAVTIHRAFGFPMDEEHGPTRWLFPGHESAERGPS